MSIFRHRLLRVISPWAVGAFTFTLPLIPDGPLSVRLILAVLFGAVGVLGAQWAIDRQASGQADLTSDQFADLKSALASDVLQDVQVDPGPPRLVGWRHYLSLGPRYPVTVNVLGTAYGLKLVTWLAPHDNRVDVTDVVETLFWLQRPTGGWSSTSQQSEGRPESTAIVLSALAPHAASDPRFTLAKLRLAQLIAAATEESRLDRTSVAAITLSFLATQPDLAQQARSLALELAHVGRQAPDQKGVWWGTDARSPEPSVAHTARALVALSRFTAANQKVKEAQAKGLDWLVNTVDNDPEVSLALQTEEVRRYGMVGILPLRHFTAAWVMLALANARKSRQSEAAVKHATTAVLRERERGLWRWPKTSEEPIWMTYQALRALDTVL
jgi:hypothetical protein